MVGCILNSESGSQITNVSVSISGGGSLVLSPTTSVDVNRATTFSATQTGEQVIIATILYTVNGTPRTHQMNGGQPVSPNSQGVLVVTADGHLVEITVVF